jgi:transcriptional regulator with XRE-family HTH domain
MKISIVIGERIRQLRKEQGLSQEEFAHIADIDRTYVTRLETGKRNVTVIALHKVIKALGTNYKEFFDHSSFSNGEE